VAVHRDRCGFCSTDAIPFRTADVNMGDNVPETVLPEHAPAALPGAREPRPMRRAVPAEDAAAPRGVVRWTIACWAAFTLLDIVKDHLFKDFGGPLTWETSWIITTESIIFWGTWGLLTPLVYGLVGRYPLGRLGLPRFMATHLGAAVLAGFLHLLLASMLFHLRTSGNLNAGHILVYVRSLAGGFLLHDVVVYWGLAAVSIAWTHGEALRAL
jgi:hypothetical protein